MAADTSGAGRAGRLVVVSGAARGIGVGICRQILASDPTAEVIVTARRYDDARRVADDLNAEADALPGEGEGGGGGGCRRWVKKKRAQPAQLDVTDFSSCEALASALSSDEEQDDLGGERQEMEKGGVGSLRRPFALINNAGVALDLPWFPPPWPNTAAADTLDVNLYGAERLTRAFLPRLLESDDGRVVFVSSGGGRANMSRMAEGRREELLSEDITWEKVRTIAEEFREEYETAAEEEAKEVAATRKEEEDAAPTPQWQRRLPSLSTSGLWLQSYGFSKACLGTYCRIVARDHPTVLSAACSPGFIGTDMTHTYARYETLKSVDEGGEIEAWLATGDRDETESGVFYQPDRSVVSWVAGEETNDKRRKSRRLTTLELK